ncbi:MAG: noeI [Verrucomicrobia bacterium]|nr:noeI [Verrucomicrobiota bacterium]
MKLRYAIKRLLYSPPGKQDCVFPYFGTPVNFPTGAHVVLRAFEEGIFQEALVQRICHLMKAGAWYFDIGANLGLMSLPILHFVPGSQVVAFEPSPNALPYLQRTRQEAVLYQDRWQVVGKALGADVGTADFFTAGGENSAFDGLKDTGRLGVKKTVQVEASTLDAEWTALGKPPVAVIKMDVEGGELAVLQGAVICLATCRPVIFCEWNATNVAAYQCAEDQLFRWAQTARYLLCNLSTMLPILTPEHLRLVMRDTEEFVLLPQ